jgi:hypothetical protein
MEFEGFYIIIIYTCHEDETMLCYRGESRTTTTTTTIKQPPTHTTFFQKMRLWLSLVQRSSKRFVFPSDNATLLIDESSITIGWLPME